MKSPHSNQTQLVLYKEAFKSRNKNQLQIVPYKRIEYKYTLSFLDRLVDLLCAYQPDDIFTKIHKLIPYEEICHLHSLMPRIMRYNNMRYNNMRNNAEDVKFPLVLSLIEEADKNMPKDILSPELLRHEKIVKKPTKRLIYRTTTPEERQQINIQRKEQQKLEKVEQVISQKLLTSIYNENDIIVIDDNTGTTSPNMTLPKIQSELETAKSRLCEIKSTSLPIMPNNLPNAYINQYNSKNYTGSEKISAAEDENIHSQVEESYLGGKWGNAVLDDTKNVTPDWLLPFKTNGV